MAAPSGESSSWSNGLGNFLQRLIACFLVLWTPFLSFSRSHGQLIPFTALAYSALLFACAALILAWAMGPRWGVRRVAVFVAIFCPFLDLQFSWFDGVTAYLGAVLVTALFWLIREHLALILVSVFATVLVASVVITPSDPLAEQSVATKRVGPSGELPSPGMIVHLILDGFAGIPGIPAEIVGGPALRSEIEHFFESQGFALHTDAISEYVVSRSSISGILNFEASEVPERNFRGRRPFVLTRNAYFEVLHERGYEINVYQSGYMDFCSEAPVPVSSCSTYRYDGTDWLRGANLPDIQKAFVLLGMYVNTRGYFEFIVKSIVRLRGQAGNFGISMPTAMAWNGIVAPITAIYAFDTIREAVIVAPPGTAHFAHLLLPHSPYVYDANCNLRDHPLSWLSNHPLHRRNNTPAGRELRYRQYFSQVRCTLRELGRFFDALKAEGKWADTLIILHGDHGSRIFQTSPRAENRERLTEQDLTDGFMTLFAVKTPSAHVGISDGVIPVSQLLAETIGARIRSDVPERIPLIYLEGKNDKPWTPIVWPEFVFTNAE